MKTIVEMMQCLTRILIMCQKGMTHGMTVHDTRHDIEHETRYEAEQDEDRDDAMFNHNDFVDELYSGDVDSEK